jgi:hypothetical protein
MIGLYFRGFKERQYLRHAESIENKGGDCAQKRSIYPLSVMSPMSDIALYCHCPVTD